MSKDGFKEAYEKAIKENSHLHARVVDLEKRSADDRQKYEIVAGHLTKAIERLDGGINKALEDQGMNENEILEWRKQHCTLPGLKLG